MPTAKSPLDKISSLFVSRQWTQCLDKCSSLDLSNLNSDQVAVYFLLYQRTILELKSDKNTQVWNLINSYYSTIHQIPIQICILEIHTLLALDQPKEASNLCESLYSRGSDLEILEIHLFSVIIPHSLLSNTLEISCWIDEKSKLLKLNLESFKTRIHHKPVGPIKSKGGNILDHLKKSWLTRGTILFLLFLFLRHVRYKYKTF